MRRALLAVTTYLRPEGLREALAAVAAMRVPPGWSLDVVVIDNDEAGSGAAVAAAAGVRHVIEPRRGIPNVRNRACAEAAAAGCDWLVFLDDDEAPAADWFERIDAAQRATGADVTLGPSVPVFDSPPPSWVAEGGFFERRRFPTGTTVPFWFARTSGVLVRVGAYAHLGPEPFDADVVEGGEDRIFFAAIADAGGTIVWADDAVVRERVPASRASFGWLVRRAYRTGNSRSVSLVRYERGGPWRRVKRVGRGVLDIGRGTAQAVVRRGTAARVRGIQLAANGAGLAAGALGLRYNEYKRIHGS